MYKKVGAKAEDWRFLGKQKMKNILEYVILTLQFF